MSKNQTWGRWDNMHHSLAGFFQGILLQSELAWEVSPASPPGLSSVIWRTMSSRSFIGSTGIIMQPLSLQGSRGEQDSGSFLTPCPRHLLCAAYLVLSPLGLQDPQLWSWGRGHQSLAVAGKSKPPPEAPPCAPGRAAYGCRCWVFCLYSGSLSRELKWVQESISCVHSSVSESSISSSYCCAPALLTSSLCPSWLPHAQNSAERGAEWD